MGMTNPPDDTAKALFETITTTLLALAQGIKNLRGHCCDSTTVMAGNLSGVQKQIFDIHNRGRFLFIAKMLHWIDPARSGKEARFGL